MLARRRIVRFSTILVLLTAVAAIGQTYDLSWYTVDGGGEMFTTGGDFELSGTIGQPDAGVAVMTGGDFELTGGFWAGAEAPFCFGDLDGDGDVDLSDLARLLANYGMTSGAEYEDGSSMVTATWTSPTSRRCWPSTGRVVRSNGLTSSNVNERYETKLSAAFSFPSAGQSAVNVGSESW